MQDKDKQKIKNRINFQRFSIEESQRLIGAFTWLIEQDKKQNPALYQLRQNEND